MSTEIVYLGHDNTVDLILKVDGTAQDLSSVTKITATFDSATIESADKASGAITWDQAGYDTGEIRMALGDETITAKKYYTVWIVTYDPVNSDGIVWGSVCIIVKSEVEGS